MVKTGRYVVVKAKRLDDILEELDIGKVGLIKVDVEGAEVHVLRGMSKMLGNSNKKIIFEANPENLERSNRILRKFGYVVSWLQDGNYFAERDVCTISNESTML